MVVKNAVLVEGDAVGPTADTDGAREPARIANCLGGLIA